MKKILLLSALAASLLAGKSATAQVRVNVQIGQPAYYDPRGAYANDDDYYYMPQYNTYYSPVRRMYYYNEGGRWMYCNRMPQRYGNVAYGRGNWQRVRGRSPWMGYRHDNGNHNGWYKNGRGNDDRAYNYNRRENNGYGNNGGYSGNNGYNHNGQNNGGYNSQNNGGYNNGNNGYNNGQSNNGYGNNGGGYHGRR